MTAHKRISFQGELGAYGHQACRQMFPEMEAVPCRSFEDAIRAVHDGRADLTMLPVDNSTYGRVADIHSLLPKSGLYIIGEQFVRVRAVLAAPNGTRLSDVTHAVSHVVLLGQVRKFLNENNIEPVVGRDTAGSVKDVAENPKPGLAAMGSELAAEIYGLDVLASDIEDNSHNTTRFLACSPEPILPTDDGHVMTSFLFRVRNLPAALYKAMGGFATNGVNMVKLESYMINGSFTATQFYAEIDGHPDDLAVQRAMEELDYFTDYVKILGSYRADESRL